MSQTTKMQAKKLIKRASKPLTINKKKVLEQFEIQEDYDELTTLLKQPFVDSPTLSELKKDFNRKISNIESNEPESKGTNSLDDIRSFMSYQLNWLENNVQDLREVNVQMNCEYGKIEEKTDNKSMTRGLVNDIYDQIHKFKGMNMKLSQEIEKLQTFVGTELFKQTAKS